MDLLTLNFSRQRTDSPSIMQEKFSEDETGKKTANLLLRCLVAGLISRAPSSGTTQRAGYATTLCPVMAELLNHMTNRMRNSDQRSALQGPTFH